jgi:hypothetical protein
MHPFFYFDVAESFRYMLASRSERLIGNDAEAELAPDVRLSVRCRWNREPGTADLPRVNASLQRMSSKRRCCKMECKMDRAYGMYPSLCVEFEGWSLSGFIMLHDAMQCSAIPPGGHDECYLHIQCVGNGTQTSDAHQSFMPLAEPNDTILANLSLCNAAESGVWHVPFTVPLN